MNKELTQFEKDFLINCLSEFREWMKDWGCDDVNLPESMSNEDCKLYTIEVIKKSEYITDSEELSDIIAEIKEDYRTEEKPARCVSWVDLLSYLIDKLK